MTTSPTILDSDFRYIDKNGILMKSRTELSIAQMLSFLGQEYEYDHNFTLEGKTVLVDFKTKKISPETKIMAVGHPKYAAQIKELKEIVFYDKEPQTGSLFMEDPSFAF